MLLAGIALAFDAADRKVPFSILITGSSRRARASRMAPRTCGRRTVPVPGGRTINIPNGPGGRPAMIAGTGQVIRTDRQERRGMA
jgi:hypothetical protein